MEMEYNTQRNKLIMPEYGRNVQKMIEFTAQVEDVEKRNTMANAIVDLMGQMNPHLRNVEEFKHKLWDHIFMISAGKLDVKSPYPLPDLTAERVKPKHIGYPKKRIKYKHYGKNVELMIDKARALEDDEKKAAFAKVIGNYMKLVYQNWNKENVNDETIKQDILALSENELKIDESISLDMLTQSSKKKRRNPKSHGSGTSPGAHGHHKRRNKKRP